ncbi:unnamed protein product [Ectocarpus sp. 8 AP-2014]
MTQTCSTAVRSFPLAECCVRPLKGQEQGGGLQLGSVLLDTPGPSLQQRSGGGDGDVDGGMGLMGNTSGDESRTTEDPYVLASLKRAIVELYDTCHRLLSFKMLNYDAFVRMMELELHLRRVGAAGIVGAPPETETETAVVGRQDDRGSVVVVLETIREGRPEALSKEKEMKVWLLEQPLFSADGLNGYNTARSLGPVMHAYLAASVIDIDWVSTRKTGGMDKMATLEKQVPEVAPSQENSECRQVQMAGSPAEIRDEGKLEIFWQREGRR